MTNTKNRGVVVTAAGTGINLALGVLYAWSVIKAAIPDTWGWSNANKALPYSVACLVFAIMMVPAGRLQDRIGPRKVATIGGILAGIGCLIAAFAGDSLAGFVLGFGICTGAGIGFGYAAATPAAVKWFPPSRTGMVAGIVVAGFGLASAYMAPLGTYLLGHFGIATTLEILGVGFLISICAFAQFLQDPPASFVAAQPKGSAVVKPTANQDWKQMLGDARFYILWLMYFAGAAAGLTFISVAQTLGKKTMGDLAYLAVVVLAVGNASGRVLAGLISDRIGRQKTLLGAFLLQAVSVAALYLLQGTGTLGGWLPVVIVMVLIGGNYGANLSLFPSATKDYFGLKNFGVNYGLLFTSWGAAGLIMPWLNGFIVDTTGSGSVTYVVIVALLLIGAALTFVSSRLNRA